jgi:predicted nuclease with RNAse H fold
MLGAIFTPLHNPIRRKETMRAFRLAIILSLFGFAVYNTYAATANSGRFTVTFTHASVNANGSAVINTSYTNGNRRVVGRTFHIPANRSQPITDDGGSTVSASVPAALGNAIDTFNTSVNTVLNGAGAALDL